MAEYEIVFTTKAELEGAKAMIAATDKEIGKLKALQVAGVATEKQLARLNTLQTQQSKMTAALPSILPNDKEPNTNPIEKKGILKSIQALKSELKGIPALGQASILLEGGPKMAGMIGATIGIGMMINAIKKAKEELKEWKEIQDSYKPLDPERIGADKIATAAEFADKSFKKSVDSIKRKVAETVDSLNRQFSSIEKSVQQTLLKIEAEAGVEDAQDELQAAQRGVKVTPEQKRKRAQEKEDKRQEALRGQQVAKLNATTQEIARQEEIKNKALEAKATAEEEIKAIQTQQEKLDAHKSKQDFEKQYEAFGGGKRMSEIYAEQKEVNAKLVDFKGSNAAGAALYKRKKQLDNVTSTYALYKQQERFQRRNEKLLDAAEKERDERSARAMEAEQKRLEGLQSIKDQRRDNAMVNESYNQIRQFENKKGDIQTQTEAWNAAKTPYSGPNGQADVAGLLMQINSNIAGLRTDWRQH